jgi:hypothetical protein
MSGHGARIQRATNRAWLVERWRCWTGEDARLSIVYLLAMLTDLLQLALERVLGAVAGFWEIAIGAFLEGVGVAVRKLTFHGVVAGLRAFVGFLGTLSAVSVIVQVVTHTVWHGRPREGRASMRMITGLGYPENLRWAMQVLESVPCMAAIGNFNSRLT